MMKQASHKVIQYSLVYCCPHQLVRVPHLNEVYPGFFLDMLFRGGGKLLLWEEKM